MTPVRGRARFYQVSSNERDAGEACASSDPVYNIQAESKSLHGLKPGAESVFQVEVMGRTGVVQ
jgi:hypothetical protein